MLYFTNSPSLQINLLWSWLTWLSASANALPISTNKPKILNNIRFSRNSRIKMNNKGWKNQRKFSNLTTAKVT